MAKKLPKRKCTICTKEYSPARESSKYCSQTCSHSGQKGIERPHTEEHTKKRLAAVKKSLENKVYPKGYKRPKEHTQPMVDALKQWKKNNPEKAKEQSIKNLPKDVAHENNGNWKGGKTTEYKQYRIREYSKYYRWRKQCLSRDGHKCKLCGSTQRLEVHHIIPISESKRTAWLRMNGVTLCRKCHKENDECWGNGKRFKVPEGLGNTFAIGRIIRSEFQEYSTCGNYQETDDGLLVIFITEQINQDYVNLIFFHEMIEWWLCKIRKISEESISNFDIEWNRRLSTGEKGLKDEPGNELNAPYHREHMFATKMEKQLCEQMGLNWKEYETNLMI